MVEFCWKWPSVSGRLLCLTLAVLVSDKQKFFAWLAYGIWLNQKGGCNEEIMVNWRSSEVCSAGCDQSFESCLLAVHLHRVSPLKDSTKPGGLLPVQMQSRFVIHCFALMSWALLSSIFLGSSTLQTGLQHCKGQSSGRGTTPLPFGQRHFLWDGCCRCD